MIKLRSRAWLPGGEGGGVVQPWSRTDVATFGEAMDHIADSRGPRMWRLHDEKTRTRSLWCAKDGAPVELPTGPCAVCGKGLGRSSDWIEVFERSHHRKDLACVATAYADPDVFGYALCDVVEVGVPRVPMAIWQDYGAPMLSALRGYLDAGRSDESERLLVEVCTRIDSELMFAGPQKNRTANNVWEPIYLAGWVSHHLRVGPSICVWMDGLSRANTTEVLDALRRTITVDAMFARAAANVGVVW